VRELEKKFSGRHVVFCAERKILPKPRRGRPDPNKQKRPRSRTLTAVYDNILDDLVFPAEIVGKRIRVKLDGSQLIKVHLDKNQQTTIEHKVSESGSEAAICPRVTYWNISIVQRASAVTNSEILGVSALTGDLPLP
jgi:small subunit ribosomal protein S7e